MKPLLNLFYENGVCTTDDFDAVFATIKPKNQRNWVQSLYLIDKYEQGNLTSNLGQQLTALAASGRFNAYQTYFVSQYIMRYNCPRLAFVLLEKFAKKPYQFAKLYQQYLKLSYYFTAFEDPQQLKIDGIVFRNFAASDPVAFCNLFKWYHIGVRSMEIASISKLYCKECL